jgi:hypothetical protein
VASTQFYGDARFTWTDGGAQTHTLALPLQEVRPAKDLWRGFAQAVDRSAVEVLEVGAGVYEIVCIINYENDPESLLDMMVAGWRGITLRYIPDYSGAPSEYHDCIYIGPDPKTAIPFGADQKVFDEHRVEIRLRRTDGGSFDQTPSLY